MKTAEEIALSYGLCTCDEAYKSRNMTAPDCPWHSMAVEEAIKEYAEQALDLASTQVKMKSVNYKGSYTHSDDKYSIDDYTDILVDKDTILNIKKQLK